jgi:hypothetical protein
MIQRYRPTLPVAILAPVEGREIPLADPLCIADAGEETKMLTESMICSDRKIYFIPVVAMPVVIDFCKKANTIEIGSKVSTVMARIRCHCTFN